MDIDTVKLQEIINKLRENLKGNIPEEANINECNYYLRGAIDAAFLFMNNNTQEIAAETKVKELEQKIITLQDELSQTREALTGIIGLIDSGFLRKSRLSSGMDYIIIKAKTLINEKAINKWNYLWLVMERHVHIIM